MGPRETSPQWADKNTSYHMVDVTDKAPTKRRAEATGSIRMSPEAFALVRDRKLPKGDALALAEVAGILAAKQTPNLLPLCHPLPIEEVHVTTALNASTCSVHVTCSVSTTSKTGVEMEALVGATNALLCLYDLIKMVEPALVLEQVRLNFKEGGKKDYWVHPHSKQNASLPIEKVAPLLQDLSVAVLTISDRTYAGSTEDKSGPLAQTWLKDRGAFISGSAVVPDEVKRIQSQVEEWTRAGIRLVITTGGTGMGPRDVTIEALTTIASKEMRGIGELLRKNGAEFKEAAWLSNSACFLLDRTMVIALPGSSKAVAEGLEALEGLLPHALHILNGGNHG